jgi:hypothetical protein
MKKMNISTFMKTILPTSKEYIISAYASGELNLYGKLIIVSDKISEPTMLLKYMDSKIAVSYILPQKENLEKTIINNKELIKNYIGIDAPYIGVFDKNKIPLIKEIRI